MNSKKLISFLCAAAMTVSAFAGFAVTASAEGEGETPAETMTTVANYTFEDAAGTPEFKNERTDVMSAEVADAPTANGHTGKALKIASFDKSASETLGNSRYSYTYIDIEELTKGASHVVIDYDSYIPDDGRMVYAINDVPVKTAGRTGIFSHGIWGSGSGDKVGVGTDWYHVTIDLTFANGSGHVYGTITKAGESEPVYKYDHDTSVQDVTTIQFTSWAVNSGSYIDNIVIQTSGSYTLQTVDPEPASRVQGSGLDLIPADITEDNILAADLLSTAKEEEGVTVLNHSAASKVQTYRPALMGPSQKVGNDYVALDPNPAANKSVYATFDFYLAPSSSLSLQNFSGNKQGADISFSTSKRGEMTVSSHWGSQAGQSATADVTLRHGTWYRVIAEVEQKEGKIKKTVSEIDEATGNSVDKEVEVDAAYTANTNYYVYRIDSSDPTKTAGLVATFTAGPRNLNELPLLFFATSASGTAYMDNVKVYIDDSGKIFNPSTGDVEISGVSATGFTLTDKTEGKISSVNVAVVSHNNGVLASVKKFETVTFTNNTATVSQELASGDRIFVWDSAKGMLPLAVSTPFTAQ